MAMANGGEKDEDEGEVVKLAIDGSVKQYGRLALIALIP